ncbi:TolC family protein [Fontivita pretiosa]|uniref:TolC family protein n=1 Tax=Fontivita pretiosa TaxID=2989684 RepID=UPI003D180D1F
MNGVTAPAIRTTLMWCVAGVLAGCATVPRDAGFADVRAQTAERTGGKRVVWNQGTEADADLQREVRSLLADELTVDEAVQIALLNNRNLQATCEDLGLAQAELVQAGLLNNPVFEFDPRWPTKSGFRFSYELSVVQDFLDVLLRPLRKKVAEAEFQATRLRVTSIVLDVAAEAKAAFYRVQGAQQLVEMRRNVVAATEASADAAGRMHEAGNISDFDLVNERALYEQAKLELARAETEAIEAREELNVLMGAWGRDTEWRIEPKLPELPETEVDPTGLESLAVAQRLDLATAWQQVQALARQLKLTGYSRMPFNMGVHSESEPDPGGPVTIGPHLEGQVPLFDQGQARVAAGRALLRQSQQRYAALAVEIRAQVRRFRARMLAARQQAEYYRRVVLPLRHRGVEEAQKQYNAMQIGVIQLLQAKQAEIDAGRDYVQALRDYWVARAELERAVGGRLSPEPAAATQPATQPSTAPAPGHVPTAHEHHRH